MPELRSIGAALRLVAREPLGHTCPVHPLFRALAVLALVALPAAAQTRAWREINHGLVNPTNNPTGPFPSNLNGLAYGNGVYVTSARGLADYGTLATSLDGISWTPRPMPNAESSGPVQFFKGKFFIQSGGLAGGTTHWSVDGVTWQQTPTAMPGRGEEYATNGEVIVGFGPSYLAVSRDGITWDASTLTRSSASYAVASDGTRFIGNNGLSYTSADGINWTRFSAGTNLAKGIHYNGTVWLVTSVDNSSVVFISSDNGTSFRQFSAPLPDPQRPVWSANGRFFQFAHGRIHASRDGQTWSEFGELPAGLAINVIHNVVFVNGRYHALGSRTASPIRALMLALDADATDVVPTILLHPRPITVGYGETAVFHVLASGATSYQWRKDGQELAGQTSSMLVIPNLDTLHAGNYNVRVRGPGGDANSNAARLEVASLEGRFRGRLVNLSVLTDLTPAESGMTVGFVVGGTGTSGTKPILVRAVGPSLAPFGVANPDADPVLELYNGNQRVSQNNDWGGGGDLVEVSARVGAFPFASSASRDAALFVPALARGDNSARVTTGTVNGGAILTEVYDATPVTEVTSTTSRLVNVSATKAIATNGQLTAGFALGGETALTVLIRVIGPGLTPFGVGSVMPNPQLTLFRQGETNAMAGNDDWSDDRLLSQTMARVGAFGLPAGSRDAALLISLPGGAYSVVASGVSGAGGQALVEVYEVR